MRDSEPDFMDYLTMYLQNVCNTHLKNKSIPDLDGIIQKIVYDFVEIVEEEYGGQAIYIKLNSPAKKQRIYNEFNGSNYNELAKKYKISAVQIRKIIKEEQKKRRQNFSQGSLLS